jgi:anaerobic ribonucleoside-triphosphate reductase activating protein
MTIDDKDETFLPRQISISALEAVSELQKSVDDLRIQVAGFEPQSCVAGPGLRTVVWVAGCHRRCPGCSQPEYLPFGVGESVSVEALWHRINSQSDIDGVTFSGGEPFEQSSALAALARRIHQKGLNVVAYTGYRLEALQANPSRFGELLSEVDLLIDGEFRVELAGKYRWRGSSNQRLICLTNRIKTPVEEAVSEMQISFNGIHPEFALSGIWPTGVAHELLRQLQKRGFTMSHGDIDQQRDTEPRGSS